MSDDSFIREVNEQIRQERLSTFWQRFGKFVIAGVVVAVLATIGYVLWEHYRGVQAAADGDRYFAAVDLATAGDTQGSVAAFEGLVADGVGAYPHLARLRIASTLAASGDRVGALARLDEVASSGAPQPLRDVAAIRAAYLLVDDGTPDDVRQRVERLTNEAEVLRHPAREALGLSFWRSGDGAAARPFFQQITEDLSAPQGLSQRARLMLEVIDAGSSFEAAGPVPGTESPQDRTVEGTQTPALDGSTGPAPEAPPAPVDVPQEPVSTDPTLTTPLSEQLDLPEAVEATPVDGAEDDPAGQPSAPAQPSPPVASPSAPQAEPAAPPPS